MRMISPLLAQNILPTDLPNPWQWMGLTIKELLVLFGAVALVTALLFVWAAYFRKKRRHHSHHHSHHHHAQEPDTPPGTQDGSDSEAADNKRYRRKRRRRREHRPRNPTLAETGGLPPLRSDRPPDPLP